MKTWEPGAKREWQDWALGVVVVFAIGLGVTVYEKREAISTFLTTAAPWWFIPAACAGLAVAFIAFLLWLQTRPMDLGDGK